MSIARAAPTPPGARLITALTRDHLDDFLPRDHDSGPHSGQAQLREAHADDRVFVPDRVRIRKDDVRERRAVGVVDDERHTAGTGQAAEFLEFTVGQHVARGVRGTRDANRADVVREVDRVEVDVVLERV